MNMIARKSKKQQSLLEWHPPTLFSFVFLFSNVGRGNECTDAAGLIEIPPEGEENPNEQVSLSLQKMVNKTKVRMQCDCF